MNGPQEIAAGLVRLIERALPEATGICISGLSLLGGGSSTENWRFDAQWQERGNVVARSLILRRAPASEVVDAPREAEFRLLQALAGQGVCAPEAWWLDRDGSLLGRTAMVLTRCPGRADRGMLSAGNALGLDAGTRLGLAWQMADVLADIHRLDAERLQLHARGRLAVVGNAADALTACCSGLVPQAEAAPEMRLAAWWLRDHLPAPPGRLALVHGDFRPANMLIDGNHISAVLDWELAHLGDPAADLGWYVAGYYRGEHFMPDLWSPEGFLARYEARIGHAVDRTAIRFWAVFAVFKLAAIAYATNAAFLEGDDTRLSLFQHRLIGALMRAVAGVDDEAALP